MASQEHLARELDEWLSSYLPGLVPPLPSIEDRQVDVTIANPFSGNADSRYAWKRQAVFSTAEDGAVNGYIKFRLRLNDVADDTPTRKRNPFARVSTMEVHQRALPDQRGNSVTYLPPDFGKESRLQGDDNKLMRFCKSLSVIFYVRVSNISQIRLHFAPAGHSCPRPTSGSSTLPPSLIRTSASDTPFSPRLRATYSTTCLRRSYAPKQTFTTEKLPCCCPMLSAIPRRKTLARKTAFSPQSYFSRSMM